MADARPFHWEYRPEPVVREVFRVDGGRPLAGTVPISGAKNAALKLLAAATLTGERCRLTNVPEIEDVDRREGPALEPIEVSRSHVREPAVVGWLIELHRFASPQVHPRGDQQSR